MEDKKYHNKKNKAANPTDKVYSLEELDEATLARFNNGVRSGMSRCFMTVYDEVVRLRRSLEDVWAIEYNGVITPEKKAQSEKMSFAVNTLVSLQDMLQDAYDTEIEKIRNGVPSEYEDDFWNEATSE